MTDEDSLANREASWPRVSDFGLEVYRVGNHTLGFRWRRSAFIFKDGSI